VKPRSVTPNPARLERYRRLERRRGLPLVAKGILAVAVLAMGGFIVWAGSGGIGPFLSSVVGGFGGFVKTVGAAAGSTAPTAAPLVSDAPRISPPDQAYTNSATVDVTVTIPVAVTGQAGYRVRLWVTLPGAAPAVVTEAPVTATSVMVVPGVPLVEGRNDLQASIIGPGGDSERSTIVTWVLDTAKPSVKVISPQNGSSVAGSTTTVKGKTQAASTVRLSNDLNSAVATVTADKDGLWQAQIAVADGTNTITITITDPAGNTNTGTLSLRHGSGVLRVSLSASAYRFKVKSLPQSVTFTVSVTGPDGSPLAGARALFSVTVPGLPPVVPAEILTDGQGQASYQMNIPTGATAGPGGLVVVQITTDTGATQSARQVLTFE
jgi:hypothetical protein